jgi:hypothetical protein
LPRRVVKQSGSITTKKKELGWWVVNFTFVTESRTKEPNSRKNGSNSKKIGATGKQVTHMRRSYASNPLPFNVIYQIHCITSVAK